MMLEQKNKMTKHPVCLRSIESAKKSSTAAKPHRVPDHYSRTNHWWEASMSSGNRTLVTAWAVEETFFPFFFPASTACTKNHHRHPKNVQNTIFLH